MNSLYKHMFDSHCHLPQMKERGVNIDGYLASGGSLLDVGLDTDDFEQRYKDYSMHKNIFFTIGAHPCHLDDADMLKTQAYLEKYAQHERMLAFGETGLDYYHRSDNKIIQRDFLYLHFEAAMKHRKPIIIHSRGDVFEDLKRYLGDYQGQGIVHCFSFGWDEAKFFLDKGFYLSFAQNITYKNTQNIHEVIKNIPEDRLLIETDAPYLPPQSLRGNPNSPEYMVAGLEIIASLKSQSPEYWAMKSKENLIKLLI